MSVEIIALLIAGYGAILSTVLLIREVLNEKRKISIILEHVAWVECVQVIITNSGHRPITLTEMKMETLCCDGETEFWEPVPRNALFDMEQNSIILPTTINDGESVALLLSPVLTKTLLDNRLQAKIVIFDSEGKEYSKFTTRIHNYKWGGYNKR